MKIALENKENKGNNHLGSIIVSLIIVLIFIIIAVVLYKVFGNTAGKGETEGVTPASIREALNEREKLIKIAEDALTKNDLDGVVDFSRPDITVSSVEIETASGTQTVSICDSSVYRPLYFNNHLTCANDMGLMKSSDGKMYCCSYGDVDKLAPNSKNFLTQHLSEFMKYTNDPDNFDSSVIMAAIVADMMSFGVLPSILKKMGKELVTKVLKPFLGAMVGKRASTFTAAISKFQIMEKLKGSDGFKALEDLKKELLEGGELLGKELVDKTVGEVGAKVFMRGIEAVAEFIPGLDILMNIEMVFELISWVLQKYDVGGFKQYQANSGILQQRDSYHGIALASFRNLGVHAPLHFNLYNINTLLNKLETPSTSSDNNASQEYKPSVCPSNNTPESALLTQNKINILKDISDTYKAAFASYHHSLGGFKSDLQDNTRLTIESILRSGDELTHEFLDTITPHINDNPTARDKAIWEYLLKYLNVSLNMNGSIPKYIQRYDKFTDTNCVNISVNQSGANIINSLNDEYSIVITKYYRDIKNTTCCLDPDVAKKAGTNKVFILEQKKLPQNEKFPLIDYSAPTIKKLCTEGMNPANLPGNAMRKKNPVAFGGLNGSETQKHPCNFDVTYNYDTGVCNYAHKWCKEMGMSDIESLSMVGTTDMTTYNNCKDGVGESIGDIFLPELVMQEAERHS